MMCSAAEYSWWVICMVNVALAIAMDRDWRHMKTEHAAQSARSHERWLARLTEADALRTEARRLRDEWKNAKMGLPTELTDCLKEADHD